jgi:hypothetical protein
MWGTLVWLMGGLFVHGVRATSLEWAAFLLFSWGLFIAACALFARLTAFGIEGFSNERRRASLRRGFSLVFGAVAGAFTAGAVTVSLATGQPGVPDRIPIFYWLWGPGLAVVSGIGAILLEREHER